MHNKLKLCIFGLSTCISWNQYQIHDTCLDRKGSEKILKCIECGGDLSMCGYKGLNIIFICNVCGRTYHEENVYHSLGEDLDRY